MSCSLLSLYPSILVPILFEWSADEDLCYLDTAVCSQTHREGVLSLMRKGKLVNTNTDLSERSEVETWIRLRQSTPSIVTFPLYICNIELRSCDVDMLASRASDNGRDVLDEIVTNGVALAYLRLSGLVSLMSETLEMYGHLVTSLFCDFFDDFPGEMVAELCPNLKELTSLHDVSMSSIVNKCSLDFIGHCNIANLKGSTDSWNYYCDLQRTTDCTDETAVVCLGDDKYYHMTALYSRKLSDEDRRTLTPLLSDVKSARMFTERCDNMWLAANCHNLTYLNVWEFAGCVEYVVLMLQQCKQLKTLWLESDRSACPLDYSADLTLIFDAAGLCVSLQCIRLFSKVCCNLAMINWFQTVSASVVSLFVSCRGPIRCVKKAREIVLCCTSIDCSCLIKLMESYLQLTRIAFHCVPELSDLILVASPCFRNLASLSIIDCPNVTDSAIAVVLARCTELHVLALDGVKTLSNATLIVGLQCNSHLRYLSVQGCVLISDKVFSSIKLCLLLRYLNVKDTAITKRAYKEWKRRRNITSLSSIRRSNVYEKRINDRFYYYEM